MPGTDKDEDRFDSDVALATGLLSPLLEQLVEALGGELEWGVQPPADDPPF